MTDNLCLDMLEEKRLGVAESTPWDAVGTADDTAMLATTGSSTTRRDTTA
jgi:hypothetical protein